MRDRNKGKRENRRDFAVCFMPLLLSCSSQTVCSITRSTRVQRENTHTHMHTLTITYTHSFCSPSYHQQQSTAKCCALLC